MENTVLGLSTLLFAISFGASWVQSPCQLGWLLLAFAGSIVTWLVCEHLAARSSTLRKYSPETFLHEGAHWLAAQACRARPTFVLGQPYVEMARPPSRPAAVSFVALAPLAVWWASLLICRKQPAVPS